MEIGSGSDHTTFLHDKAGNVIKIVDPSTNKTTLVYDDLGRLTDRQYVVKGGNTWPLHGDMGDSTYTYDLAGRMLTASQDYNSTATASDSVVTMAYDNVGRMTDFDTDIDSAAFDSSYAYTLDANTNRVQMDYPSGLTLRYDMDRRNRVTSIYDADASASVAAHLYDDANRLTQRDFGNSRRATWGYDSRGQVTDITHNNAGSTPTICDYNYGYDDAGRPRWREDTVTSHLSEIYGYDNGNRLTTFERGILDGSPPYDVNTNTTFTDLTQIESWNLDLVGNWEDFDRQRGRVGEFARRILPPTIPKPTTAFHRL